MTFAAHMRAGSLEVLAVLGAFALVAGRVHLRPVGSAVPAGTPVHLLLDVRQTGGIRRVRVVLPAIVGRAGDADLPLEDAEVSRRHARLDADDGVLYVTDLRSSNGTFLNGEPVSESIEIRRDDTIDVGNVRLTVLGSDAAT